MEQIESYQDRPTKHVLLDDLRRHSVLRKKKSKNKVTPRGDELCTDAELRHVLGVMHKKYFGERPRVTTSSLRWRRRDHRKRKRSKSRNDDL